MFVLGTCSSVAVDAVEDVSVMNMSSTVDDLEHRMVRLGASARRHVVKAIVFYGRRGTVQMLNCYLERNLLRNGGLLSEVLPCPSCHLSSCIAPVWPSWVAIRCECHGAREAGNIILVPVILIVYSAHS